MVLVMATVVIMTVIDVSITLSMTFSVIFSVTAMQPVFVAVMIVDMKTMIEFVSAEAGAMAAGFLE